MADATLADWHYIGNYGQLGPLTDDQMKELIEVGVIESSTYVWCEGMKDWAPARNANDLIAHFANAPKSLASPPPPPPSRFSGDPSTVARAAPNSPVGTGMAIPPLPAHVKATLPHGDVLISDKRRVVAGLLNFLPGFGRFYLGYYAIGALQFFLFPCGFGYLWSVCDGICILGGACPEDGFGRRIVA